MSSGWWDEAACLGVDVNVFFPERQGSGRNDEAMSYCQRCRVREECLTSSIKNNEQFGTWGGMSQFQRQPLLRPETHERRVQAGHGDAAGTITGYYRHCAAHQEPCTECKAAYSAHNRTRRQRERRAV